MAKMAKEKWKTYQNVLDEFALRTIHKLISQNHFSGLESPISIGKEANVFSATTKEGERVIVKIYRLETCDFNRMYDYIRFDEHFVDVKKQRRKVIFAWAQREFRNLMKTREAGIRVPKPITFLNNCLVMEFIGDNDPAPKLKDAHPKNPKEFFKKTFVLLKKLTDAGFVHTDLSEYNILNHNENPVFIDMSQCCSKQNPNFREYLRRDIKNVDKFFRKLGVDADDDEIEKKILK